MMKKLMVALNCVLIFVLLGNRFPPELSAGMLICNRFCTEWGTFSK